MGSCISRLGYSPPQYCGISEPANSFACPPVQIIESSKNRSEEVTEKLLVLFDQHSEVLRHAEFEAAMEKQLQEEAAMAQAEHARAHEMSHSVECLAMMLAKRIIQEREENTRREEELADLEKVNKLKDQIIKHFREHPDERKSSLGSPLVESEKLPEIKVTVHANLYDVDPLVGSLLRILPASSSKYSPIVTDGVYSR